MTTLRRPRRAGFALIELLATITVLTVLLGLCAGLLHLLLKLDRSGRDAMEVASDQARLGRTFRDDLHRASLNTPPTIDGDRLTVNLPDDGRVVYAIESRSLVREYRQRDKLRQRESYRYPARSLARFEAAVGAGRPMMALIIRPEAAPSRLVTEPDIRVEAEVGRVDRLSARKP